MNAGGIESGEQVLELKNKSSKKEDVMNYDSDDSLDYDEVQHKKGWKALAIYSEEKMEKLSTYLEFIDTERRKARLFKLKVGIQDLLKVTHRNLGITKSFTTLRRGFFAKKQQQKQEAAHD